MGDGENQILTMARWLLYGLIQLREVGGSQGGHDEYPIGFWNRDVLADD